MFAGWYRGRPLYDLQQGDQCNGGIRWLWQRAADGQVKACGSSSTTKTCSAWPPRGCSKLPPCRAPLGRHRQALPRVAHTTAQGMDSRLHCFPCAPEHAGL